MRIGSLEIDRPLCLAPMDDVTDYPFRHLCREQGADLLYTEFASCEALVRNVGKMLRKIVLRDEERPIAIQIYGSAEESMERAAAMAENHGADFVDVNCGCWVKKIATRGDGAGLLRDLNKFEAVVRAVVRGTRLPVTVKTRLGWDDNSIVILDVARMLEDLGVSALTVHCRTRVQGYTGRADWSWLARIREVSKIPLIANGDIVSPEDAQTCLDLGCDGVMIGRGAIGNPWIFRQVRHYLATGEKLPEPTFEERVEVCIQHLREHVALRGEPHGVYSFRRNYAHYLKSLHHIALLRRELMTFESVEPIAERLRQFVAEVKEERHVQNSVQPIQTE